MAWRTGNTASLFNIKAQGQSYNKHKLFKLYYNYIIYNTVFLPWLPSSCHLSHRTVSEDGNKTCPEEKSFKFFVNDFQLLTKYLPYSTS